MRLQEYINIARKTDKILDRKNHFSLLIAGLVGEAGSIISEFKKQEREQEAYPQYLETLIEELGDFLWYLTRITDVSYPEFWEPQNFPPFEKTVEDTDPWHFNLIIVELAGKLLQNPPTEQLKIIIPRIWNYLFVLMHRLQISLETLTRENSEKIRSRWPQDRSYFPLFDQTEPEEEQLPRNLTIEFLEKRYGENSITLLRCNGLNFGDRLSDNIKDEDGYRFHDIFHFSYAVHLGWSPVTRALLRTKRKSNPKLDDSEDGARAIIIEEAVSATVFAHAKHMQFFQSAQSVDYSILKMIKRFIQGYEVDKIPLWQWETAILDGFKIFNLLKKNSGGIIELDLNNRRIEYEMVAA